MRRISLGPRFAAELRGVDLIDVATNDAAYCAVREAFEEHSVILFRNQETSDDVQVAFSRAFGSRILTLPTDLRTSPKPSAPRQPTLRTPSATCRRTRP